MSESYLVTWQIIVEADTPREAAEEAFRIHRDPDSIATVFGIKNERTGATLEIDLGLDDDAGKREPPRAKLRAERKPKSWMVVHSNSQEATEKMRVERGWLYRTRFFGAQNPGPVAITFMPDGKA